MAQKNEMLNKIIEKCWQKEKLVLTLRLIISPSLLKPLDFIIAH